MIFKYIDTDIADKDYISVYPVKTITGEIIKDEIRMLTRLKNQINFECTDAQKKMNALNTAIEISEEYPNIARRLDYVTELFTNKNRKLFRINGVLNGYENHDLSAESALKQIRDILKENKNK